MYRVPGLHGGVQIVERPAGGPCRFLRRRRLPEPPDLDANNYTLITFNEVVTGAQPDWVFGRQLCMHCEHPACASACPTTAMFKTDLGPVVFDESRCIGCRACCRPARSSFRNMITRASRRRSTMPFCADAWKLGSNRRARRYVRRRMTSATATTWLPKRSGGLRRPRALAFPEISASTESAAPASCIFHRCRSRSSATLPACRRRRCPTHAQMVARHGTRVRRIVRDIRRAELDRAPAHAPPRA